MTNELQRDLLPLVFEYGRAAAPALTLRVVPSGVPSWRCCATKPATSPSRPRLPGRLGSVLYKRLFEDCYRVFFDGTAREAPRTLKSISPPST